MRDGALAVEERVSMDGEAGALPAAAHVADDANGLWVVALHQETVSVHFVESVRLPGSVDEDGFGGVVVDVLEDVLPNRDDAARVRATRVRTAFGPGPRSDLGMCSSSMGSTCIELWSSFAAPRSWGFAPAPQQATASGRGRTSLRRELLHD